MLVRRSPLRLSPATLRWTGILLSLTAAAALVAVLANADWRELARPLITARWEWLGAALILALVVEVIKTVRWQLLLAVGIGHLPELLAVVFGARLLNALTLPRAGDVWRIAFVARV